MAEASKGLGSVQFGPFELLPGALSSVGLTWEMRNQPDIKGDSLSHGPVSHALSRLVFHHVNGHS
jgi:hypothetical protein